MILVSDAKCGQYLAADTFLLPHTDYGCADLNGLSRAGCITCNYDGEKKHKTIIESNSFIGSGTRLVAPVKVGKGSYIAAGSTVTKDTPGGGSLTIARSKQVSIPKWKNKKIKGTR